MGKPIRKKVSIAGRAKQVEVLNWRAEERWLPGANKRTGQGASDRVLIVSVRINADPDKYWDGFEAAQGRANEIATEIFGADNYDGPWHD